MTKKTASEEALELLHAQLANALAERLRSGEVTAADLNVARQFLKDNNIDAQPTEGSPLADLRDSLPFPNAENALEAREERERYN